MTDTQPDPTQDPTNAGRKLDEMGNPIEEPEVQTNISEEIM